jgi:microsomal dipeptidase-like Zn-dependent dipeptidase
VIADLHAHYPMHLIPPAEAGVMRLLASRSERARSRDRLRAILTSLASRMWNYPTPTGPPAVTVGQLRDGDVGLALSVLYVPLDEMDLGKAYGSPPDSSYFPRLLRQLELVEARIAQRHADVAVIAHSATELEAATAQGKLALVHCVEGGFHLGATAEEIERNVAELARRGVAYIGPAHLFWRGVATNVPALPFLPDWVYRLLFPQPRRGLTVLGEAAVRSMVRERVLVDVTHMSERSLDDTFELLGEVDPERRVPLVASHMACRFGGLEYNMTDAQIGAVAQRDGVMGVILCDHYAKDGLRRRRTQTFEESFEIVCSHIDRVHRVTGTHAHAAIGSDLDGYIKPTLRGLEDASRLARLEAGLVERYGPRDGGAICAGNVMRVLRNGWGR